MGAGGAGTIGPSRRGVDVFFIPEDLDEAFRIAQGVRQMIQAGAVSATPSSLVSLADSNPQLLCCLHIQHVYVQLWDGGSRGKGNL